MKKRAYHKILTTLGLLAAVIAAPVRAEPVTVFAAASLREALDAAVALHPETSRISYGGSGAMARQVSLGAPADLVILAHPKWMDWLVSQDHVTASKPLLSNRLVLIGPATAQPFTPTADSLRARLADNRLAIGQRDAVPAGQYARAWLENIKAWDAVQAHLAETQNVRAALALVARGDAPLGVVYATDAQAEARVKVLYQIPENKALPIYYPVAARTPAGAALLATLASPQATAIFAAHGFGRP